MLFPTDGWFLDRFRILRELGSGNMGVVYEAEDKKIGTRVALKVLSESSAAGIYRLKQEFRSIADIVHPNLVGLHELISAQGEWFFTMDLVPGDTLLARLEGDRNLARFKNVFSQLATGIHAIHKRGKLHRDIKPNNVLLTPEDRVVILDFGLVSEEEKGGVGQTLVEDGVSGTPAYMAPELTMGQGATRAGDWYAFGVMMFEALVGRLPFEGTIREVLTFKALYDPPALSSLVEDVPDDVDTLCVRLLSRDPSARPGFEEILSVLGKPVDSYPVPPPSEDVPFVGREEECAFLREALEVTHAGRPCVAMVQGPSGVGKSTLVEHFLDELRLARSAVVLSGRCFERESVPFKGCDSLIDSITHYLRRLPARQAAQMLPRQILALSRIFPVLHRLDVVKHTKLRYPLPPNPHELRRMAFLAAKELLANIAAQEPLVLFVDDLQWSDTDGAKLLSSFFSSPDAPPVLLVASVRTEDSGESRGLETFSNNLKENPELEIREIHLRELNEENSRELAARMLPPERESLAPLVARESRGNPYFISTLAQYLETSDSGDEAPRLDRAVVGRLNRLSPLQRDVFEAICLAARPVDADLLGKVIPEALVAEELRTLEIYRWVRRTGNLGAVTVYHERIRTTVLEQMPPKRAEMFHLRFAQVLEATAVDDPVMLTEHWLGAGELQKAGAWATEAARHAEETLAFENAARFYKIAIEHNAGDARECRQLETAMGEALANAGRRDEAAAAFIRAADGATEDTALDLKRRAAQQLLNTGRMDQGVEMLDEVLRALGMKMNRSRFGAILQILSNRAALQIRGLEFTPRAVTEVSKRELLTLNVIEDVMVGMWAAAPHHATIFAAKYLRFALKLGLLDDVVKGLSNEAVARSFAAGKRRISAGALVARAEELAKNVKDPETHAYLNLAMGMAVISQGDYIGAVEHLRRTEQICLKECTRKTANLEIAQSFLGLAYTRLGKWKKLQEEWDRWTETAKEMGNLHLLTICRTWPMGVCRWLARDNVDAAKRQLQAGIEGWPWRGFDLQRAYTSVSETYVYLYAGDYNRAFSVCDELWKTVTKTPLHANLQMHRIVYTYGYAQSAINLAGVSDEKVHLINLAESRADDLARERSSVAEPYFLVVTGAIAALRQNRSKAVEMLRLALASFDKAQYKLCAAAVRMQLGRYVGGEDGAALVAAGETAMQEEAVVDPWRVSAMLVPVVPPDTASR